MTTRNRIQDILGRRDEDSEEGAADQAGDDGAYKAYEFSRNGRPVMGFYIAHKDGNLDGFMFHSVNHPKFQMREGQEFLSFTHSGAAVVMTGRGLRRVFDALMAHTLRAIFEHDGQPTEEGAPIVTRVSVTQAVPARIEPLELVKPAKQAS